jgi:hypothetical protein
MAKLTIPEAATLTQKHRSTLYRAIEAGRLSCDPDGRIDTAELLRAGYTLQPPPLPHATPPHDEARQPDATTQHHATPQHVAQQTSISPSDVEMMLLKRERDMLQQHLDTTRDMLQQQLDATRDYREQIRYLSQLLHDMQQRYDRLLEAPRPPETPSPVPVARQTTWQRLRAFLGGRVPGHE